MNREDAEEYTQGLGQIFAGSYRQVVLAHKLGVPKALGLSIQDWVHQRLGGYVKMNIPERRNAIAELKEEGHSNREIADVLGVAESTVRNDLGAQNCAPEPEKDSEINGYENDSAQNCAPTTEWREDELERKDESERGFCVVANIRGNGDPALVAWAKETGRFVRIDRNTEWGNPFEMPDDGDRNEVCEKFADHYFPHKNGLQSQLSALRGKVLGCWCAPERCHGHFIAETVNGEGDE